MKIVFSRIEIKMWIIMHSSLSHILHASLVSYMYTHSLSPIHYAEVYLKI